MRAARRADNFRYHGGLLRRRAHTGDRARTHHRARHGSSATSPWSRRCGRAGARSPTTCSRCKPRATAPACCAPARIQCRARHRRPGRDDGPVRAARILPSLRSAACLRGRARISRATRCSRPRKGLVASAKASVQAAERERYPTVKLALTAGWQGINPQHTFTHQRRRVVRRPRFDAAFRRRRHFRAHRRGPRQSSGRPGAGAPGRTRPAQATGRCRARATGRRAISSRC